MNPAIKARTVVKNSGLNPITAIRVAGNDPAKIATPIKPLIQPIFILFIKKSLMA